MRNKIVDFIKPKNIHHKSNKKRKKILWYSCGVLGVLLLLAAVLVTVYWGPTQQLIESGTAGKDSFLKAQDLLLVQD